MRQIATIQAGKFFICSAGRVSVRHPHEVIMPANEDPPLRPADRPTLLLTLSFALRHDRRAVRQERENLIARLAAEHVLDHLERSNYVVMQKPAVPAHTADLPSNPKLTS